MGAVLIEEAGCEGLQCGMGQQGRPSVDEGGCHGVPEKGCPMGHTGLTIDQYRTSTKVSRIGNYRRDWLL